MKLMLLLCLCAWSAMATEPGQYQWQPDRKRYELSAEESAEPVLVLKHHSQHDYALEGDDFFMYTTMHRIIYVNSNEAVKKHNQIFIRMDSDDRLTGLKARTISKSGKVTLFDESNLKEIKSEESGLANRIFAIEGAEVGSEIEYYYTKKTQGLIYRREFVQFDEPIKSVSFAVSCPKHLKFDFRSYNGLADVKQDDDTTTNIYRLSMENIPALREEPYSFYDPNRMRVEFKLWQNTARSKARLYTWDDAAKRFHSELSKRSKDDEKALTQFVATLSDKPKANEADRIKAVEEKIKTFIRANTDLHGTSVSNLEPVLKNKVASAIGMMKVFLGVFEKLGIPTQIVMTCSRENVRFDSNFDSWSYLEEYLIYFPRSKAFLAPYHYETRYPLVPEEFTAQKALFIEELAIGDQKSALGSIGVVPEVPYQYNQDNLDIEVDFAAGAESNTVHQVRTFTGYSAFFFTPYYDLMDEDKRVLLVDEVLKQTAPDVKINKWSARIVKGDSIARFIVDTQFSSSHFIERAGNRILFKAGLLIGPQSEMYRDDVRNLDIENTSNRAYMRVIKVNLPQGYTSKNLDALKINVGFDETADPQYLFRSDYTLKGSVLEIRITEWYKKIGCPKSKYEDFRRVINAAADFNKVVLVLEKQ